MSGGGTSLKACSWFKWAPVLSWGETRRSQSRAAAQNCFLQGEWFVSAEWEVVGKLADRSGRQLIIEPAHPWITDAAHSADNPRDRTPAHMGGSRTAAISKDWSQGEAVDGWQEPDLQEETWSPPLLLPCYWFNSLWKHRNQLLLSWMWWSCL